MEALLALSGGAYLVDFSMNKIDIHGRKVKVESGDPLINVAVSFTGFAGTSGHPECVTMLMP